MQYLLPCCLSFFVLASAAGGALVAAEPVTVTVQSSLTDPSGAGGEWSFGGDFFPTTALHGDTLVVGAAAEYFNNTGASYPTPAGVVTVYNRFGATWSQAQRIQPIGSAGADEFGRCVAVHGTTLVATRRTGKRTADLVFFERKNGSFTQTQVVPTVDAGDGSTSVTIPGGILEETSSVVGRVALGEDLCVVINTSRIIFIERRDGRWNEVARFDNTSERSFLKALPTISGNLVLAPCVDGATSTSRTPWQLFERVNQVWRRSTSITPAAGIYLAGAIDGDTAVFVEQAGSSLPAVVRFAPWQREATGEWTARPTIILSNANLGNAFVHPCIGLSGDLATIGMPGVELYGKSQIPSSTSSAVSGAAYHLVRRGGAWSLLSNQPVAPPCGNPSLAGHGAALGMDGSSVAVADFADNSNKYGGQAQLSKQVHVYTMTENSSSGSTPDLIVRWHGVDVSAGDLTPSTTDGTDFGSVDGSFTNTHVFSLVNRGAAALSLTGAPTVVVTGAHAGDFLVSALPGRSQVRGGEATTVALTFAPTAAGARTANVTVLSNDADVPAYTFAVTGTGGSFTPVASMAVYTGKRQLIDTDPGTYNPLFQDDGTDFLRLEPLSGLPSPTDVELLIRNTGTGPLVLGNAVLSNSAQHVWMKQANRWSVKTQVPASIPPGGKASLVLTYAPNATTDEGCVVVIPNNDPADSLTTVAGYRFGIVGPGKAGAANTTPATGKPIIVQGGSPLVTIASADETPSVVDGTDLGNQPISSGAKTQLFTVKPVNDAVSFGGATPIVRIRDLVSGGASTIFTVTEPLTNTLAVGASDTVTVAFDPSAVGVHYGLVEIYTKYSTGDLIGYSFVIKGTGTNSATPVPGISVSGDGLTIADGATTVSGSNGTDFGGIAVNGSTQRTFAIANPGDATLTYTGTPRVAISGSGAFSVLTQPATDGDPTLLPGTGTQSLVIRFAPSTVGGHDAVITIASNAPAPADAYTFSVHGEALAATASSIQLADASVSVAEDIGTLNLTVTRLGSLSVTASLQYTTANGTAVAPGDYATTSGTLSFAAGEPAKVIPITIVAASGSEPNESFTLTLSAVTGTGATLGSVATATITITDAGAVVSGPGDLNGDKVVNVSDLTLVTSNFGKTSSSPGFDARADSNGDGVVNVTDLTAVTGNFGKTYL